MGVANTFVNSEERTRPVEAVGISPCQDREVERAMGFEPTTSCLGSKHSTPELRPLEHRDCTIVESKYPLFDR